MKRYVVSAVLIAAFVLFSFLLMEFLGIRIFTDPTELMQQGRGWAALIGGGLLVADVFIPVPSSVVMIAHGAILGIWVGFFVSFFASITGAMLGWWLGRNCQGWVLKRVSETEQQRAKGLVESYGVFAIVVSRMLPIVSETISIMSGLSGMDWKQFLIASALGSVFPALVYSIAGAFSTDFFSGSIVAAGVFVIVSVSWLISRKWGQKRVISKMDTQDG